ncbi:MAG TPA: alpha/beta hydrolase-fold protein [Streptosporangiaceae bacterium]|nr:alpha/beta hydrolase-fold protein [Streptosporangiaceae bacterium]
MSRVAGWHLGNSIARLVNLIGLVPILATASAEYYWAQPDADWSNSDNIAGHACRTADELKKGHASFAFRTRVSCRNVEGMRALLTGLSRRGLLIGGGCTALGAVSGGAAYGLVEHGVLPGKYRLDAFLGACGGDPGVPRVATGPVVRQQFYSRYRKRVVNMITMLPPGHARGLPVVLALHGAGGDAAGEVGLGYSQYLAAGAEAFAVVAVDGGGATYWHPRADGDDPQGMLIYEVLPRLQQQGYRVGRVGLSGQSMGGYGALLLAARLGPAGVAAVAVSSAAIFGSYADAITANPGSFDSPADFAAHNVRSADEVAVLRRIPVRIDCGSDDPFAPQDTLLRASLRGPNLAGAISGGCHDARFFQRYLPAQLSYLGQHLQGAR